jgi:hypothetical protein
VPVTGTLGASTATGSSVPANAFYTGVNNQSGNLAGLTSLSADGTSATAAPAFQPITFNGTTWDRLRSAPGAAGTTGAGVMAVGNMGYNGTNYNPITTNSNTYTSKYGLDSNLLGSLGTAFTTAGYINVLGGSTSAAIPSYAVTAGSNAVSADPTATTTTYNTPILSDLLGKQIQLPYAIPQNWYSGTANTNGTTSTLLISAVSGYKLGLTQVTIVNTGGTTTFINLQDGSGGTTKYVVPAPAGGGAVISLPTPVYNSSGNAWFFAAGGASTTIYVSATAFASKV